MSNNNTALTWLMQNDYQDVADLIRQIMDDWKAAGNKQRRNWWDILAGDKNGNPRKISGRVIPVLKAAQIRKEVPISQHALCRNKNEDPPVPIKEKHRWSSLDDKPDVDKNKIQQL